MSSSALISGFSGFSGSCFSAEQSNLSKRTASKFPSGLFRVCFEAERASFSRDVLDFSQIVTTFFSFFREENYELYDSCPLTLNDPTLLLTNSTMAHFKPEMLADKPIGKRALTQLCFRARESDEYLYAFNMVGISADISHLDVSYKDIIGFLEKVHISKEETHVILWEKDQDLLRLTFQFFPEKQVHFVGDENEKYSVRWKFGEKELTGRGLTFAAKASPNPSEDPMDDAFVPLGNIIIVRNELGEKYVDIGFGVECILSYFQKGDIFQIPFFNKLIVILEKIEGLKGEEKTFLKNLLGYFTLHAEEIFPGPKKENYIALKIQNRLFEILAEKEASKNVFDQIYREFSLFFTEEEKCILQNAISKLKENYDQFCESFAQKKEKAKSLAEKWLKKKVAKEAVRERLHSVLGLPKFLIGVVMSSVSGFTSNFSPVSLVATRWSTLSGEEIPGGAPRFGQGSIKADQIARKFLGFFETHEKLSHFLIKGASVVPQNDPTLLFINSGMAAMKAFFTGEKKPDYPRLCNVQPCIRTNDIDDIGDMHHLSFFHMMGSWGIKDYGKKEAAGLAFDLLIKELGFPKDKLYFTVFSGDKGRDLAPDDETAAYWRQLGVKEDHIVYLPAEDNFWGPAGDTGPCGPCTEIFYDMGDAFAPAYIPGNGKTFDTQRRYVEIWNGGVFMQYFMHEDKSVTPLEFMSVDTGSGLERMTMTMNGFNSVYETDLLKPIFDEVCRLFPGFEVKTYRMITDHIRTATYLVSEGVFPGNVGQQYIVKKLVRKCVTALMQENHQVEKLKELLVFTTNFLAESYVHFKDNLQVIPKIVMEEVSTCETLIGQAKGLVEQAKPKEGTEFSAKQAFLLIATKGIPLEILSQEIADLGFSLDTNKLEELFAEHRNASKKREKKHQRLEFSSNVQEMLKATILSQFVGYETDSKKTKVTLLIKEGKLADQITPKDQFWFCVEKTPFYPEGGGQCGDRGTLTIKNSKGDVKIRILDTKKVFGQILHLAVCESGVLQKGRDVSLQVDPEHRAGVRRNHSATHLLHFALRKELNQETGLQEGSKVESDLFTFDFKSSQALTDEQIDRIEKVVNQLISNNHKIFIEAMNVDHAREKGVIGMFNKKYSDTVRVISMGPSAELCGGTHAKFTGDLNFFAIEKEEATAKGVRRITAVTGFKAVQLFQEQRKLLSGVAKALRAPPKDVLNRIEKLEFRKPKQLKVSSGDLNLLGSPSVVAYKQAFHFKRLQDKALLKAALQEGNALLKSNEAVCGFLFIIDGEEGVGVSCISKQGGPSSSQFIKKLIERFGGKGGGKEHYAQGMLQQSPKQAQIEQEFSLFLKNDEQLEEKV